MKFIYPEWHRLHHQDQQKALKRAADKSGLPPGSLVHIGAVHELDSRISVVQYNEEKLVEYNELSYTELGRFHHKESITWINVDGLSDTRIVERIGREFNIHPLVLEDILSTHQRPKLEEYDDYFYLVVKGISMHPSDNLRLQYDQISILLLANHVITFKERGDDVFQSVYHRLKNPRGRLRKSGSDYLAYVLLDTIVDEYFVVEEGLDDVFERLEDDLLMGTGSNVLQTIQQIRRELITMKRNISPLRELLTTIKRSDTTLLTESTLRYFEDIHDHVLRVTDTLESYREIIASLQDVYLSSISNKMNETMKVLTIFASIFIPLTFIAGVYGMNFEYMPELKWRWGYPVLWAVFISIGLGLLALFKKKKWL
ncbi:MAG: magnesium/cobalt transporter CorA [Methyloprofundus sp.]|nr:magnesium/cobalt transporter CorA [Methyloprofundus sp.]MBW6454106.1 magnesium/cobalt transporter CorA [Methyloprofundus sp.]